MEETSYETSVTKYTIASKVKVEKNVDHRCKHNHKLILGWRSFGEKLNGMTTKMKKRNRKNVKLEK